MRVQWWVVLGITGMLASLPARADQARTYVVLINGGQHAGQQRVTQRDDGSTQVDYVFKDNGRGPELKEHYTLRADGTLDRYRINGISTYGAKVDERFDRTDGKATWTTTSDQGETGNADGRAYIPLAGTPQMAAVIVAAGARHKDGQLPLLPEGNVQIRTIDQTRVTNAAGDHLQVQLVQLSGLDFSPEFVWMTQGEQPRLFARILPGYTQLIEQGWQRNADLLEQRQVKAESKVLRQLQHRLGHRLAGTTVIRNARVFDSARATLMPASDVVLRNGRIVSIQPHDRATSDHALAGSAVDHVLEAAGRTLLPGLFDMHAHVDRWSGGLDIAAGVTSVRDMGNDNPTVQAMMAEERDGHWLGPRIVPAGFIEGESEQSSRGGFVIANAAQARQAVDWYARHGYPQIKIYSSFPKDILKQTVAYAHAKGLRVSGHVPAFLRAQDVVDAGFDEIQHINQLVLNFLVTPKTDTRTLERFYLPARAAADLDLDGKPVRDFIATLAERKIAIDPTLATFEFLYQRNGQLNPIFTAVDRHLPPNVRRYRRAAELDIPDAATAERYKRSYDTMVQFVGRAWKAGVPILAGTDETPGFTLQREFGLYVQAGIPAAQVLKIATFDAARAARAGDDRGRIAPGLRADLILVDGDPTTDIAAIGQVSTVIKGETIYYPAQIYAELGVRPFAAPVQMQRPLMKAQATQAGVRTPL